ncbi:MAG: GspE/PulE family protein [Candidatus Eisenbacteria bacterium]
MRDSRPDRIGRMLVSRGIIDETHLAAALDEQARTPEPICQVIIRLSFAPPEEVLPVLAEQRDIPYASLKTTKVDKSAVGVVPAKCAYHYKLIPLNLENSTLSVLLADPFDPQILDELRLILGYEIKPVLGESNDILEGLKEYYGIGAETVEKLLTERAASAESIDLRARVEDIGELSDEASIINFVNQLLLEAFKERSTDIHIEPFENDLRIRFRIDGILYDISVPASIRVFHSAIVSRIKIMANLNIAERRLPQDGRVKIRIGDNELDLRISILPTQFGETVDIRLLNSASILFGLENLGLSPDNLRILERMIEKPHGIILVTGPTGSGKTTTLYASLSKINSSEKKIITIEDPIEYQLHGISQMQIAPKIGLGFSNGLRYMLRHDPDIMMVGEIRDSETAEIAIQVALTGHLVFSTVHTNDAASTVIRLVNMGIEPYLAASSVECIIAQRLIRLVCPYCKTVSGKIDEEVLGALCEAGVGEVEFFEGRGCDNCRHTGYKGRTGIYEVLEVNERMRELIMVNAPSATIKNEARTLGMKTLREDGLDKALRGLTTISEVLRVTQEEEAST